MRKIIFIIFILFSTILSAQIDLTIEGIDSAVTNNGYVIPRTSPTLLTFRNSRLIADGSEMYILRAGDDSWGEGYHNNLDNAIITGNYLFSSSPGQVHGIMAGYNINYDVRYNYIEGSNYVVFEGGNNDGTNMINITGGFSYNIFKNNRFYTFGYDGVFIYNNTFYSNTLERVGLDNYLIRVSSNSQLDITVPSKNVKIKNNIFYSVYDNYAIVFMNNEDTIGFRCDYNVYYWDGEVDHTPKFFLNGTKTWAQWQALGYDKHSVIIDPQFIDTDDFVPGIDLYYGTDLGDDYDAGLTKDATWVVNTYPDTVEQGTVWQIGARIDETITDYGGDYFVSPTGDDDNPGTYELPWKTWGKAFNATEVQPGDTVYFRGGGVL